MNNWREVWRWVQNLGWRRQLAIGVLAVILVSLGLSVPALTQPPIVLTMLLQAPEVALWQSLGDRFEAEHPNIRFKFIEGPVSATLLEDLLTSAFLLGESPYDLVYMDVTWVPKFAAAGWLQDLSDRLTPEELAQFLTQDLEGGRYRGKLYRLPVRTDTGVLYYRKDLLEQAGLAPPETFDALMEIGRSLQQRGKARWGYLWQGKQYEGSAAMFVEVLAGFGGFWIDPAAEVVGLDQPEAIAAVSFLVKTIDKGLSPAGVLTYQEEETRRIFQQGEAVFLRNWPYVWPLANAPDSPVRGKIGIAPMVHQPGQTGGSCKGGWGLGISQTTPHPEAAWQAVQFFMRAASQREISLAGGYLPAQPALFTDPILTAQYPFFPDLLPLSQQSVLRPPTPQYAQASDILQRYLTAAFSHRLTPAQAMSAAADETRRLLRVAR